MFLWTSLFLGPPLAMIWRDRRYAADAMAVQLTRNPDGLARACRVSAVRPFLKVVKDEIQICRFPTPTA